MPSAIARRYSADFPARKDMRTSGMVRPSVEIRTRFSHAKAALGDWGGKVESDPTFPFTIASMRWVRLAKIWLIALKYGLDEFLLGHERFAWLRPTVRALTFWRDLSAPRAVRLRVALEALGPDRK